MMSSLRFALKGTIWVCAACGKTHKDRYGEDGEGDRGWDESCMLKAVLCEEGTYPWVAVDLPAPAEKPAKQEDGDV